MSMWEGEEDEEEGKKEVGDIIQTARRQKVMKTSMVTVEKNGDEAEEEGLLPGRAPLPKPAIASRPLMVVVPLWQPWLLLLLFFFFFYSLLP